MRSTFLSPGSIVSLLSPHLFQPPRSCPLGGTYVVSSSPVSNFLLFPFQWFRAPSRNPFKTTRLCFSLVLLFSLPKVIGPCSIPYSSGELSGGLLPPHPFSGPSGPADMFSSFKTLFLFFVHSFFPLAVFFTPPRAFFRRALPGPVPPFHARFRESIWGDTYP